MDGSGSLYHSIGKRKGGLILKAPLFFLSTAGTQQHCPLPFKHLQIISFAKQGLLMNDFKYSIV